MNSFKYYINFCSLFHHYSLPKLKFKELSETYRNIYQNVYLIDENDINKASFLIFVLVFSISILISLLFISINLLIILFYSLILSLIVSYKFNLNLYKEIKKDENIINALLYLIKINFSLISKTYHKNSDYALIFVDLIKNYNLPISESFKIILRKIHEGEIPEGQLLKITTPSENFNKYLKDLLVNNFEYEFNDNKVEETNSEKNFRIILRDIESKISIIFFIGLFFPIGLCFLILFHQIDYIIMILFIPFFLILLNFLYKKFIKIDIMLIGLLNEYSNKERRKFDEFLFFLRSFAINLKTGISPEKAFINSYSQNKSFFKLLKNPINTQITHLLSFSGSFRHILKYLKLELNSLRYNLILNTIEKMIDENAYYSSDKVFEILDIISKHRRLEEKLGIIIKGEMFKVFFFLFLLPIIIGAIGGLFPLVVMLTNNQDISFSSFSFTNYIQIIEISIIFITLLFSNLITSYYFLKIIHYEKKYLIMFLSCTIYTLVFFITFMNLAIII